MSASLKLQREPKERGLLMKGPLVLQALVDLKTQTRRVITAEGAQSPHVRYWRPAEEPRNEGRWVACDGLPIGHIACPYGAPGDRLWVRETLRGDGEPGGRRKGIARYAADGEMVLLGDNNRSKGDPDLDCATGLQDVLWQWQRPVLPAIHMPRWACRLVLELTEVRVQRVQDISEEDAKAEGVELPGCTYVGRCHSNTCPRHGVLDPHRGAFRYLWDSINEDRGFSWDANPWVWALTFKRVEVTP